MTKTTLMELSHKYATVLRKCAILNAMVLGVVIANSVNAATITTDENGNKIMTIGSGEIYTSDPQSYLNISKLIMDSESTFYMPENGLNVSNLIMDSTSTLNWNDPNNSENKYYGQNGVNIDNANFSGKIDMGYASAANEWTSEHYVHVIHTTNTRFSDVEVIGHKNPDANNNVNWGDHSSFWSNALTLTNNVKMTDTQVSMTSPTAIKTNDFFAYDDGNGNMITPNYFNIETGAVKDSKVVYNGGLYEVKTAGSYTNALYNDIKNKIDDGILVAVDVMDQFTPFVGSGITYKQGDVFIVSDTNETLKNADLIDENDSITTMVAYEVKAGKEYKSLTPTDMLTEIIKPVSGKAGVSIVGESADKMANIALYHSVINSFGANTDEAARITMENGYKQLKSSLLEKLKSKIDNEDIDDKDTDFYNKLSSTGDLWNTLRLYDGENEDIKRAYKIADATMDQYRQAEFAAGALPYTIQYANLEIGKNASVALETSGNMLVDHSNVSIWGVTQSKEETGHDGSASQLKRNGKTGDLIIQDSNISLYANAELSAETEGGNDKFIANNSTINLKGSDRTLQIANGITNDTAVGASISSTNGLQLTNGSTLNAVGGTDGYEVYDDDDETIYLLSSANIAYLTNSKLEIDESDNWKEGVETKALYVIDSTINIGDKNGTPSAFTLYHEGEGEAVEGGTIALDMDSKNSEVNLFQNSTLTADIASLNTDTDAGVVNFYNNSRLNGTIYRANVFAKDKTTKVNGTLALNSATLDIGTNALVVDKLSLDNSTIATHIDTTGNGTIKAGELSFGEKSSEVKLVVDNTNAISPEGTTIDFMTGEAKEIGDNLTFTNIMYDFKYNSTTGQLSITPNGNSGVISLKDLNDRLAASSWLSGGFENGSRAKFISDALNDWQQTDPESFAKAVKQLKPMDPNVGTQVAGQNNQQVVDVAFNHGNNGNGNNNGKGQGNGKGNNGNAYGHNNGHNPHGRSGGDTFNNVGVWAQGLYNYAKLDGSNGYKGKTKGIAMGVDGMLTDNLKLGIAYAYTTTDVDTDTSNTDVDTHTGVLYGEYLLGNAFVNAATTYSYSKYDGSSSGLLGNIGSDYHMDSIYGQVMSGYHFDVNNNITLTPEGGLRYLWTKAHSYTDTADQHIKANTSNTWTGVLGGRASMAFATEKAVFIPELKLAATYDLHRDNGSSSVHLANGSSYVVEGEALKRLGIETGASVGMTIDNMDFSLSYEGRFKKDYQDHTGMINFRYNF